MYLFYCFAAKIENIAMMAHNLRIDANLLFEILEEWGRVLLTL
tara:strand:+ start:2326 stop:2454 length:129 start_codon:yes stop_codon:yes gene_type:complete